MTQDPIVLGFDTSAHHCTAAVVQGDRVLAHRFVTMPKGQAENLMGIIDDTLAEAGTVLASLSAIGVGIGPGNFTGIRISVSAARGLALGLGCKAVGVSGFDALRYGVEGPCACAIDARRGEVYVQQFDENSAASGPPAVVPADSIPVYQGPLIGVLGADPKHPIAIAIAAIAAQRHERETQKPAPFYIRPADAAPARDAGPILLS